MTARPTDSAAEFVPRRWPASPAHAGIWVDPADDPREALMPVPHTPVPHTPVPHTPVPHTPGTPTGPEDARPEDAKALLAGYLRAYRQSLEIARAGGPWR